jgi:hypothetical protein
MADLMTADSDDEARQIGLKRRDGYAVLRSAGTEGTSHNVN